MSRVDALPAFAHCEPAPVDFGHFSAGAGIDGVEGGVLVHVPVPPSTNALTKNVRGVGRVKTREYANYLNDALLYVRRQRGIRKISGHVVMVIGVERNSLVSDIDNRVKALFDLLVRAEVVDDDRFVTAFAISWMPKADGLAHVFICPAQQVFLSFHPSKQASTGGWVIEAKPKKDI